MAMNQAELQAALEQQAAVIQQLQTALGIRTANDTDQGMIDINNHVVHTAYKAYPKVIYRPGGSPKQIDHPGLESMKVADAKAEQQAVEEGWFATIQEALDALHNQDPQTAGTEWPAPKKGTKR